MQEYLGLLIAAARRRTKQAVLARVSQHQLTVQQFWMLVALQECPGFSQVQLAERVRADSPTVSRTLTALLERGLVRSDLDPSDRRRSRVTLTAAGQRLAAELTLVAREIREAIVDGMSPPEIEAIRRGLRRVIANLDRLDRRSPNGGPPR
jgi:DNA-binding MarR family transcriptional regulator